MSLERTARTALGVWCLAFGAAHVHAQPPVSRLPPASPRVYLITVGQGDQVWEKFGHNALWFFDDASGIDEAYNWGIFDFKQPHFVQRFLTGDTRYWVESYPGVALIDFYKSIDRGVVIQRLNLTPEQARKGLAYARWNARDENKFYRYDYFRDNCSTRVRDVIDYALGGALKARTANAPTRVTYKSESVRLVNDLKFMQVGIYTALGEPADRRLSMWQDMFIPMRMRDIVRGMRVAGAGGAAVPLVADERVLYQSKRYHERADEPRLWIAYLIVGLLIAAEFFAVGRAASRAPLVEKVFRIEVLVWALVSGILGLVLLLAWTSTQHVFWFRNENLLLLNPLSLWLAVTLILSMRRERFARQAALLAGVVCAMNVIALLMKAIPAAFPQDNLALILLVLPANAAIALSLRAKQPV